MKDEEDQEPQENEDQPPVNDGYDLLQNLGAKVHTKTDRYNVDAILSNLSDNERIFVREQTKLTDIMSKYIQDTEQKKQMKRLLSADIEATILLSRAKQGMIIKALLKAVTGKDPQEIIDAESLNGQENKSFLGRLFGRNKA